MNNTPEKSKESTPLMQQYELLKSAHPDEILLFRLGDFYELFFDDARKAAPVLEVALTQRQGQVMCGIPYHALDRYLSKLLAQGLRVAIAEQMADPATTKGIVPRQVVRIISAGTVVEENLLKEKSNNFLMSLALENKKTAALGALDISTGEFFLKEISLEDFSALQNEFCCLNPAEVVVFQDLPEQLTQLAKIAMTTPLVRVHPQQVQERAQELEIFWKDPRWQERPTAILAGNLLLTYALKMNPAFLPNISAPRWVPQSGSMVLDAQTLDNLEILRNNQDGTSSHTLLDFMDDTLTPMGARLLKQWITRPLLQMKPIQNRLDAVEFFLGQVAPRKNARELLKGISDLERAIVRLGSASASPRDLIGIKLSLQRMGEIKNLLLQTGAELPLLLREILAQTFESAQLIETIAQSVVDEPPLALDQGGVIRPGFNALLDEKRQAADEGKQWLQSLEAREKAATGISTLRIGYTSVFGYYFEVTKTHLAKVPAAWHRKQTLVNAERFISEELKTLESKILGAEEQALRMERGLFQEIVRAVREKTPDIQSVASAIAQLDSLQALAQVAETHHLARPQLEESCVLELEGGWHPVVKCALEEGSFVANDTHLGAAPEEDEKNPAKIMILTGPNMSGKSTYLRQNALIVLMAQIGSFVPAQRLRLGLVDRVFTRIGSGDRLSKGESTFMVEMQETAQILKNATDKSLIILDEVGRGTSTYDGISIAWAIVEHLAQVVKAKTLFATHYFELTQLEQKLPGVKNFNVQAKEWKGSVLFLHKIVPGPADRSYGVHVAQLAGLPQSVVLRSQKILQKLEQDHQSLLQSQHGRQLVFKLEAE